MRASFESLESRTLMSASMPGHLAARSAPSATSGGATQRAATRLYRDLLSLYHKGHIPPAQLAQLESDSVTALAGASKPSAASVARLKGDLKSAFSDKSLSTGEKMGLASDLDAILASANVSTASAEVVSADVSSIIQSSGITSADVKLLIGDLSAVAGALKSARA